MQKNNSDETGGNCLVIHLFMPTFMAIVILAIPPRTAHRTLPTFVAVTADVHGKYGCFSVCQIPDLVHQDAVFVYYVVAHIFLQKVAVSGHGRWNA